MFQRRDVLPNYLDIFGLFAAAGVEAGQAERSKGRNALSQCTLEVMALRLRAIQAVVAFVAIARKYSTVTSGKE